MSTDLVEALEKIAGMDPGCLRADDLGRAARIAKETLAAHRGLQQASEPMQPLEISPNGVMRFRQNRIVRALLGHGQAHGFGLNEIAIKAQSGEFNDEEQMQLAQLIGYSLDGYGSLEYVTAESYERAKQAAKPRHSPLLQEIPDLQALADQVVLRNAVGLEGPFLRAVEALLAGVRALKRAG